MSDSEAISIIEQMPLAQFTSWRIGGRARFFTEVDTVEALRAAVQWGRERDVPMLLLGGGTNMLISDAGFDGLVLRYRAQSWHLYEQADVLYAEAGVPMSKVVWGTAQRGWGGIEWAAGLPGTLGGAVYGNAGCYGGDIAGVLSRAWMLVDGDIQQWPVERLAYGYRSSILKAQGVGWKPGQGVPLPPIILVAEMRVTRQNMDDLMQTVRWVAAERKRKTPVGHTCGSVFQNPSMVSESAGQLIDRAGLRGERIGQAQVSEQHANYIINLGGASSDDVLRLIELVRQTVFRQFGLSLDLEIQVVR